MMIYAALCIASIIYTMMYISCKTKIMCRRGSWVVLTEV
jgi:hypothetical protein